MRICRALTLVTLTSACTPISKTPAPTTPACLPYPSAGIRPPFAEELRDDNGWHSDIEVSADGKRVAFTDLQGRLVAWDLSSRAEPILYAGSASGLMALTRYGGAYSTRGPGQLMRTDLDSGRTLVSWELRMLPIQASSAHVDASGRYVVVSSSRGAAPTNRDVIVLDDCVLQGRPDRECGGGPWRRAVHTDSKSVADAYLDGDLIVARETPPQDASTQVVVRRLSTGEKLRSWDPGEDTRLLVTHGYAVESETKSGKLHLRTIADGAIAGEVFLGAAYASDESGWYRLESGKGDLVVVSHGSDDGPGKTAWRSAIVDIAAKRIVWQTAEPPGAIGLGPDRRMYTATTRGVCSSTIGQ